jgi:hypothetical protein
MDTSKQARIDRHAEGEWLVSIAHQDVASERLRAFAKASNAPKASNIPTAAWAALAFSAACFAAIVLMALKDALC